MGNKMTFRNFAKLFGLLSVSFVVLTAICIWSEPKQSLAATEEPSPATTEEPKPKIAAAATEEKCRSDDRQCVTEWFSSYKERILNEFRRVRELESQIAGAMRPRNEYAGPIFSPVCRARL